MTTLGLATWSITYAAKPSQMAGCTSPLSQQVLSKCPLTDNSAVIEDAGGEGTEDAGGEGEVGPYNAIGTWLPHITQRKMRVSIRVQVRGRVRVRIRVKLRVRMTTRVQCLVWPFAWLLRVSPSEFIMRLTSALIGGGRSQPTLIGGGSILKFHHAGYTIDKRIHRRCLDHQYCSYT